MRNESVEKFWSPTLIYDWILTHIQLVADENTEKVLTSDNTPPFLVVQRVQEDWEAIYGDRAEW